MPEIKLENITKRWGKFFGVDNVSLDIPDNSFITLLGPSGCGKTTILRMIAGLETPTEGRITIGDRVVFDSNAGINVPANKRKVGFLFQNYALWPNMTVYENISFGLKNINEEMPVLDVEAKRASDMLRALSNGSKIKEIVEECRDKNGKLDEKKAYVKLIDNFTLSIYTAKELFNLKVHESSDPTTNAKEKSLIYKEKLSSIESKLKAEGKALNEKFEVTKDGAPVIEKRKLTKEEIDSKVRACSRIVKIGMFMDRYPAELSGGQQQRVSIARALALEPEILFFDEPTSALDPELTGEILKVIKELAADGMTMVIVTHEMAFAHDVADKVIFMEGGVIVEEGSPDHLFGENASERVKQFLQRFNS